jgi:hypothetical protein
MLLWWGHPSVYASTFCTQCLRIVMRQKLVCPLGVWSLTSVFNLWQIFMILSSNQGYRILLENRLSWSPILNYGTRVKAKFLSFHQFRLTLQLLHHHLRLCLLPSTLKLLLLSLCLLWDLSSGRSVLLESMSSSVRLTFGSAWNIITRSLMMMTIESSYYSLYLFLFCFCCLRTIYLYETSSIFIPMVFLLYYVYPSSFWDKKRGVFFVLGPRMYFQTGQVFFVPEWPKGEFVSILYWQHSGWQKYFMSQLLFNRIIDFI